MLACLLACLLSCFGFGGLITLFHCSIPVQGSHYTFLETLSVKTSHPLGLFLLGLLMKCQAQVNPLEEPVTHFHSFSLLLKCQAQVNPLEEPVTHFHILQMPCELVQVAQRVEERGTSL